MRPGHCIHEHSRETFSNSEHDYSDMSIQPEADQLIPYVLFPDPRIGLH